MVTAKIKLPVAVTIQLQINKLVHSVVGHILAAKNRFDVNLTDRELRSYFKDTNALPPATSRLLFRIYPYDAVFISRDSVVMGVMPSNNAKPNGGIDCLSFYPLAFTLTSGMSGERSDRCGLLDLFEICSTDINEVVDLRIDLLSHIYPNTKMFRHPLWPCNVSDEVDGGVAVLTSGSSLDSVVTSKRNEVKKL